MCQTFWTAGGRVETAETSGKNFLATNVKGVPRPYETPIPIESPEVPRHRATAGSYGGGGVLVREVPLYYKLVYARNSKAFVSQLWFAKR